MAELVAQLEKAGRSRGAAVKAYLRFVGLPDRDEYRELQQQLRLNGEHFFESTVPECWMDIQDVVEFCEGYVECDEDHFIDNFDDILWREQECRAGMEQRYIQFQEIVKSFKTMLANGGGVLRDCGDPPHEVKHALEGSFTDCLRALIETGEEMGDFFNGVASTMRGIVRLSESEKPQDVLLKWMPTATWLADACRSYDRVFGIEATSD
ncbi:hypothetical protein BSKO_11548 [Bryopsis sp. KO-2023]|nr:hypothetical protein BSKO_11548 [Bryopsis sp. KO-2023]